MRSACIILVASLFLAVPSSAGAQTSSVDDEAIRKLYNDFFQAFIQGGFSAAIESLRQSGSIDPHVAQELERQFQGMGLPIGRADSYEVVHETQIAHITRFRTLYFLTHHETQPMAWGLRFYKKVTGVWVIVHARFELEFVEDFLRLPEVQFAAYRRLLLEERRSER